MPALKTTDQILQYDKNIYNSIEDWMKQKSIFDKIPEPIIWTSNLPIKIEQVDVWEVILETPSNLGVYAAWQPYDELYIVTKDHRIVEEFSGKNANKRLEKYLIYNEIPYPKDLDSIPEHIDKNIFVG